MHSKRLMKSIKFVIKHKEIVLTTWKKYAKENYNNNLETIISSKDNGNKTFWQVHLMGRFMGKTNNSTIIPP